ncbi:MAG: excinuclease ABC subunit UvrC [Candidatus Eisenbacteria bacterium]|nr:excinuclease ABC subunit UvrC [Candidatus Eisenbacteria bacterium]
MGALNEKVLNLPAVPGVYLFKDAAGRVLYVGKALSLVHRVRGYLSGDVQHPRLADLMSRAADLDSILTDTESEALLLEATLIRQHRPHFNILLKDDKSFPYVRISVQEEIPRLSVTRRVLDDGARYLGPYTDVKRLRRTLREIRRVFPVRTCRNFEDYRRSNRPCLYFHIRRCAGPCTTRSRVTPPEYRALVDGLVWFLTGRDEDLLKRLRVDMGQAANERRYEQAARLRDQLRLLEQMRVPQKVVTLQGTDTDVLGLARHGDRAAVTALVMRGGRVVGKEARVLEHAAGRPDAGLLSSFVSLRYLADTAPPRRLVMGAEPEDGEALTCALEKRAGHRVEITVPSRGRELLMIRSAERNAAHTMEDLAARASGRRARFSSDVLDLQRMLALTSPPWRVVCFDVSNLGPDQAVAAVVASENGRARKGLYRRMRMRRAGPDDFAMIGEAVERYWTRVESGELPRPDLVLVDGGPGQLGAARAALARVSTRPVEAIALAKREETVVREGAAPLQLPRRSPALRTLQRLRDEAHRFGLAYHRTLRSRARLGSDVDRVPGVGPARRAALLRAFGSVAALRDSSADEIAARARLPASLAERVFRALQSGPGAGDRDAAARRNLGHARRRMGGRT